MIDQASVPSLMGSTVRDNAGDKIGKVGQVYLDDTTGKPEWVTVKTGLFGTKETFVPLAAAHVEGDVLVVDIAKERVSDAPKIDEDGHLSEEQETELYAYYGVSQGEFGRSESERSGDAGYAATGQVPAGTGVPTGTEQVPVGDVPDTTAAPAPGTAAAGTAAPGLGTTGVVAGSDYDTSNWTTAAPPATGQDGPDSADPTAGTDPAARARLRKYVGTEAPITDPERRADS